MAASNYPLSLKNTLEWEGGYTNDAADPGGPTNWGITIRDAQMYWKHDATATDVMHMPLSVAQSIYKAKYWDKMSCDLLPAGVDYAVFDYGVNSGIGRAPVVLQHIVGVPADGIIGPATIEAVNAYVEKNGADALISAICKERLAFLKSLRIWSSFGKGWARRVAGVLQEAKEMAA
jgi:lysozyme family protein